MKQQPRQRLLVISQVYVPDPASVGQHMADAAEAVAAGGYAVRVLASARGYEDPAVKYPSRELRDGVEIRRLPLSSFGKKTILLRLLGQSLFLVQAILRGLLTPRLCGVLVSTSPPMCSIAALIIATIRRVPIKFWVMDINPDQLIALGKTTPDSLAARAFDTLNRRILRRAKDVVVLDRFMAERVLKKVAVSDKVSVLPPWPHVDAVEQVPKHENPFTQRHGTADKFVVMYSGNHSIASPLTTLLAAALRLQDDPRFLFMFVGGGLGKQEVDETIRQHRPPNIVSLPYQPLDQIKYSLAAADLHVVALGDAMVGIIHPCKIYGAMAVGRPVLLLGPSPSHAADLIDEHRIGWQVGHGEVDRMVETLQTIAATDHDRLVEMGNRARRAARELYSKQRLRGRFANIVTRGLPTPVALPVTVPTAPPLGLEGRRVLLLGAPGLLGSAVSAALEARGAADVLAPPDDEYDLSAPDSVLRLLDETRPHVLLQFADASAQAGPSANGKQLAVLVQSFAADHDDSIDFCQVIHQQTRIPSESEQAFPQRQPRRLLLSAELFGPRSPAPSLPAHSVEQLIASVIQARDSGQAVLAWQSAQSLLAVMFVGDAARAVAEFVARGTVAGGAECTPESAVPCVTLASAVAELCAYEGRIEIALPDGNTEIAVSRAGSQAAAAQLSASLRDGLIETIAWVERSEIVADHPDVSAATELSDSPSY